MFFSLLNLAEHEEIQSICRAEVLASASPEFDDCQFLKNAIRETLRLKPTAPLRGRTSVGTTKLTDDDGNEIPISTGLSIVFSIYNIHRNPKYFPDPERFDPNRFSGGEAANYFAFGAGPRKCPGEMLALMEIQIVLGKLLRNFKFTTCPEKGPIETKMALTLVASHGNLKVEKL